MSTFPRRPSSYISRGTVYAPPLFCWQKPIKEREAVKREGSKPFHWNNP